MKNFSLILLLGISLVAESRELVYESLLLNGGLTSVTKETIESKYGKGTINYTKYECGFNSNDQAGAPYYQIIFHDLTFIGSDKEAFTLERFNFSATNKNTLTFKGVPLNSKTTKEQFIKLFGKYAQNHFNENTDSNEILLFFTKSDDGARFKFKNNKLLKYVYWSPC